MTHSGQEKSLGFQRGLLVLIVAAFDNEFPWFARSIHERAAWTLTWVVMIVFGSACLAAGFIGRAAPWGLALAATGLTLAIGFSWPAGFDGDGLSGPLG